MSLAAGITYALMEWWASKITQREEDIGSKGVRLSDIREFPRAFWLLCLSCMLQYCVIFPFLADAPYVIE